MKLKVNLKLDVFRGVEKLILTKYLTLNDSLMPNFLN